MQLQLRAAARALAARRGSKRPLLLAGVAPAQPLLLQQVRFHGDEHVDPTAKR